jgi:putative flippase GtrA
MRLPFGIDRLVRTALNVRPLRFALAGMAATILHVSCAASLHGWYGFDPLAANLCGFLSSVALSYVLNRFWVFRFRGNILPSYLRFVAVALSGLTLSSSFVLLAQHWSFGYSLPMLATAICVPVLSYMLNKYWTFAIATGFNPENRHH